MRFQPVKCNMMQLTRKRIKKIHASYTLEGSNLENVESIKYLGETITSDLRCRVRATDRHCRQMRRKIIFGTKKHDLAKTSGEKKFSP